MIKHVSPIAVSARRCCRKSGGLNLGISFAFPVHVWFDDILKQGSPLCSVVNLRFGLLFWVVDVEFRRVIATQHYETDANGHPTTFPLGMGEVLSRK